ncbi:MAG: hypothetical protein ACLFP8_07015 [Alphaproteobacteria bacterium]
MILLSVTGYNRSEHCAYAPFLADLMMSDEENTTEVTPKSPASMGKDWGRGFGSGRKKLFENPDDFDIVCDRERGVNYIFHGPELNCTIDHLEYDHDTQHITVITNDRQRLDLGARIQWLVRPYIAKEQYLFIIRTKDGKIVDGVEVPLKIKTPEITNGLN